MSFGAYQPEDQVLSSDVLVSPMWSENNTQLTTFFSWSFQESTSAQGRFYLNVFKDNINLIASQSAETQFSIAYGHIAGSGSAYFNPLVPNRTPTRDIYGQYRSLIFGDENSAFTFGSNTSSGSRDIIVISVARSRFKESFNPGSFFLRITSGSSPVSIGLVDDSTVATTSTYIGTSRVYQLLSGSYNPNTQTTVPSSSNYTVSGSYGMIIPDEGLIILNPRALALPAGALGGVGAIFNEFSSSQAAAYFAANPTSGSINNRMIFQMISSSAVTQSVFNLQSSETISSRYFFTRVKNSEFNYTSNPTVIDSNGNLLYTSLIYNPQTFMTSVGLYNDTGDLLAIAKLNKPLVKDFTKELLLRVKLDF